jgi:MFS family permease
MHWGLSAAQLGQLTSATQLGFILGTLLLATLGLADRFAASRIFLLSSILGACFNAWFALGGLGFEPSLVLRFMVGMTLAGIYPLGMKLIISWSTRHTGTTLGLLVAMLTLGSALPHGVRAIGVGWSWQAVVLTSSVLALMGGVLIHLLGEGPHLPPARRKIIQWADALKMFLDTQFRASAAGYFGHMWEVYAFWTLVPFLVADLLQSVIKAPNLALTAALSFLIMGVMGASGAIIAGHFSQRYGSPKVAAAALFTSGLMCLLYPIIPDDAWPLKFIALIVWGLTVVADSAQFSATSAKVCPPNLVGGALAIQNSIGFLISVFSISLVMTQYETVGSVVTWYLLPGPVLGLALFWRLVKGQAQTH